MTWKKEITALIPEAGAISQTNHISIYLQTISYFCPEPKTDTRARLAYAAELNSGKTSPIF